MVRLQDFAWNAGQFFHDAKDGDILEVLRALPELKDLGVHFPIPQPTDYPPFPPMPVHALIELYALRRLVPHMQAGYALRILDGILLSEDIQMVYPRDVWPVAYRTLGGAETRSTM